MDEPTHSTSRGVETIALTNSSADFPATTIALSLTGGFTCMLLVERAIHTLGPHSSHTHTALPTSDSAATQHAASVEFDVELGALERAEGLGDAGGRAGGGGGDAADTARAYPLTLGLMVHALADGFALGASATAPLDRGLSLTVFLALLIHKGASRAASFSFRAVKLMLGVQRRRCLR